MSEVKRRQKPQVRRAQILEEAICMLGDHGFNGLTVQALAERCGISNAGLLYYFRSKDELLLAVLDEFELRERESMRPFVAAIEACGGEPGPTWTAIMRLFEQMVARFADRPELARLLFVLQSEALDRTHIAHAWFRQREDMTLELFASLIAGFAPDPVSTGRLVMSTMHGLGQHWLRQDMAFDLLGEWRKLFRLVTAPIPGAAGRPSATDTAQRKDEQGAPD